MQAIIWDGVSANSKFIGVLGGGSASAAYEINNDRFVAGHSEKRVLIGSLATGIRNRAFIWHSHFGMYELPLAPGSTHCYARSLNNRTSTGAIQVVGHCTVSGKNKAVRWTVLTSTYVHGIPPLS